MSRPENFVFDIPQTGGRPLMTAIGAKRANMWAVDWRQIRRIPGYNIRHESDATYSEHVEWLADSLAANGYMPDKPMVGYTGIGPDGAGALWLTDGYSRLEGIELAVSRGVEIGDVTINLHPQDVTPREIIKSLRTGNKQRSVTPLGLAILAGRMVHLGASAKEIAEELVIEPRYVSDLLLLIKAPLDVREKVRTGEISATLAIQMLRDDVQQASERIAAASAIAKAAGKGKVTAKHVKAAEAPLIAVQDAPKPQVPPSAQFENSAWPFPNPDLPKADARTRELLQDGEAATKLQKPSTDPGPTTRAMPHGPATDSEILAWLAEFFARKDRARIEREDNRVYLVYRNSSGNNEIMADGATVAAAIDHAMTVAPFAALARGAR